MIKICYFARLREELGTGEEELALPDSVTDVNSLRRLLSQREGAWNDALSAPAVLIAVNHETAQPDTPIKEGDEVAFFPPVTGG